MTPSSSKCTLCVATRWTNTDVYFHRIPGKAAHMKTCDRWLEFLGLRPSREWDIPKWKNIVLCSLHFEVSCYSNPDRNPEKVRVVLKLGSIPTRNPPCIQTMGSLVEFSEYQLTHGDTHNSVPPECSSEINDLFIDEIEIKEETIDDDMGTSSLTKEQNESANIRKTKEVLVAQFHNILEEAETESDLAIISKYLQLMQTEKKRHDSTIVFC